jgi:solute:Na+ symporter, SSS family
MGIRPLAFALALVVLAAGSLLAKQQAVGAEVEQGAPVLFWERQPPLPDAVGFAGSLAGVHRGALIVAGGANFPNKPPSEGGEKVWYDSAFVLPRNARNWSTDFKLPRPGGYGVSLSTDRGVACLGGSDAQRHFAVCFLMKWDGGSLQFAPLPDLPRPCANSCGALVGDVVYIAGGIERPDATTALHTFWSLDLSNQDRGWQELEPWPGPGRMLAAAGAQGDAFYLFGGAALSAGSDGKPVRQWLRDAYRYTPGGGWRQLADLPRAAVAAPSPAPALGASHLLVLGGDDGAQTDATPEAHQGFPRSTLAYHTITDTWIELAQLPFSLVTTPAVASNGRIIIPGGESQPGRRSTDVWEGRVPSRKAAFGWLNYTTLAAYLLGMVGVGWYCSRRNKNTDDYFRASGRIPWWAAGISIYATMLSSLTFMAIPAKAYATDWTFFWSNVPILLLAPLVISCYLPFFRQLNVTSAYEYLERRFNLAARLYASAAFILFQLGRQAIVLLLPSLALATVSDLNVTTCILAMGVMCVLYTVMGGIEAVIWTDVVQTGVLLGAAVISLALIVMNTDGGIGAIWSTAMAADKFHMFNWTLDPSEEANAFWAILIGSVFVNLIPYTSDQTVVQRYMTTPDETDAKRAIWTNALLVIPSTALFFAIGTALFVYYRLAPQKLDPTQATDAIFPSFIVQTMPVGLAGLVIAGIFAAAQSTVSSSLNSVTTALMTDFYGRFGGQINNARGLRLARWITAAIGVFATGAALVLARLDVESLWDAYLSLVGLAGSGLAGLFALGIFTRTAHGAGAMVGALASAGVLYWVERHTDLHFLLHAAVGFLVCVAVGWFASRLIPAPSRSLPGLTIYDQSPSPGAA